MKLTMDEFNRKIAGYLMLFMLLPKNKQIEIIENLLLEKED